MDRLTKLVVIGWACAAVALQVWLLHVPGFGVGTALVFAVTLGAASGDRRTVALVLGFIYIFPIAIFLVFRGYQAQLGVIWMAGLLGVMLPDLVHTPWHLPARWRLLLVCWALVAAVGATLVVWREIDFTPGLLTAGGISNSFIGGTPGSVASWVLHVALVAVLGILWMEWLFGADGLDLRAYVLTPMAVSCLVMGLVAVYQLLGDVTFFNPTNFGALGRASGTMFDGNVCGTIAALWLGCAVLLFERAGRTRVYLMGGAWVILWLALWASGSRSALVGGAIVTVASLIALYGRRRGESFALLAAYGVSITSVLVLALAILYAFNLNVIGPLARMPSVSADGLHRVVSDLWTRQQYGTTAVAMIREFPWFGVGIGCFPSHATDYGGPVIPDNAQNWFRHELAELGIVGSLAWIVWVLLFTASALRIRKEDSAAIWACRGILVGFGLMSLVGVPGQDVSVAITFWTVAFWFAFAAPAVPVGASDVTASAPEAAAPIRRWAWAGVVLVVLAYGAGTARLAAGRLRVPVRAQRVGWPYEHGFYPPAPGARDNQRWTSRRAVAVIDAPTRWMAVTVSIDHRTLLPTTETPSTDHLGGPVVPIRLVDVKIWRDGQLILRAHLTNTAPVSAVVRVPDDEKRVLLETWVSRVLQPKTLGLTEERELGALVKWEFVDAPPSS